MMALGLLAGPIAANAVPIKWDLDGVTFADGGTAIGFFVYDADSNAFTDISITTSVNGVFGTNYGVPGVGVFGVVSSTFFDTLPSLPASGQPRLLFDLLQAMTNDGGTIGINLPSSIIGAEGFCASDLCSSVGPYRFIISGAITSIPEPGTLALFGLGLAGLGFARRRRAAN